MALENCLHASLQGASRQVTVNYSGLFTPDARTTARTVRDKKRVRDARGRPIMLWGVFKVKCCYVFKVDPTEELAIGRRCEKAL